MLPYTALQWLLLERLTSPVVMTSANRSGEPIHHDIESIRQWAPSVDGVIYHDRVIERPIEDSVVQALPDNLPQREQTLRLGRGLAPLVMDVPADCFPQPHGNVLAMGGELKNSIAVAVADAQSVVMSPYQGDLYDAGVFAAYRDFVPGFLDLLGVRPQGVVVDAHPDYHASRYGEALAAQWQLPLIRVQHHHAHAVAVMAEHGLPMDQLLPAIVMDGLGWGDDNTLWGGELLVCNGREYERLASLQPFALLGGNQAARQPWRNGLALLGSVSTASLEQFQLELVNRYPEKQGLIHATATLARSPRAGLLTSSVGRLFDGVASLLGFPGFEMSDEAEAAVWLQQQAQAAAGGLSMATIRERTATCVSGGIIRQDAPLSPVVIDPAPFIAYLLREILRQSCGELGLAFHGWLAESFVQALCALRQAGVLSPDSSQVVLGGGVMQNGLLLQWLTDSLQRQGFSALLPGRIPANDNGLALGQAMIGQQRLASKQRSANACV
jgi:hydrogenase maturation protein HypF